MLAWHDNRWNLDDLPIHAGDGVEMLFPDGQWLAVRIEEESPDRRVYVRFSYHGMDLGLMVNDINGLRWPAANDPAAPRGTSETDKNPS